MRRLLTLITTLACLALGSTGQEPAPSTLLQPVAQGNFDLLADDYDPNGFLLNPYWRWQSLPGNKGLLPDPDKLCSNGLPNSADCTSQPTWENLPGIPKVLVCMWSLQARLIGHINWKPAVYTGGLLWQERSTDQDCNWGLRPQDNRGLTHGNLTAEAGFLGLEFDSRETIRAMHTEPWTTIWTKVANGAGSAEINQFLSQAIPGGGQPYSILVGLAGVDCEHDCHTELHPIYAAAAQLNPSAADNTWGIMVRNWGNEGFCAHGQTQLPLTANQFKIFLPHQGSSRPTVKDSTRFYSNDTSIAAPALTWVSDPQSQGVLLTFNLKESSRKGLVEFELHLTWADGSSGPSVPAMAGAEQQLQAPRTKHVEDYLQSVESSLHAQLAAPSSFELMTVPPTQAITIPKPYPVTQVPSRAALFTPEKGGTAGLVNALDDPVEQQQADSLFSSLCAGYNDDPPNIPKGACASWRAAHMSLNH